MERTALWQGKTSRRLVIRPHSGAAASAHDTSAAVRVRVLERASAFPQIRTAAFVPTRGRSHGENVPHISCGVSSLCGGIAMR